MRARAAPPILTAVKAKGAGREWRKEAPTWAAAALAVLAVVFLDLSGRGSLWATAVPALRELLRPAASRGDTRLRVIPARYDEPAEREQRKLLAAPDLPAQELRVTVAAPLR